MEYCDLNKFTFNIGNNLHKTLHASLNKLYLVSCTTVAYQFSACEGRPSRPSSPCRS